MGGSNLLAEYFFVKRRKGKGVKKHEVWVGSQNLIIPCPSNLKIVALISYVNLY